MEYSNQPAQFRANNIFYKVYGWMAIALVITGLTAYFGAFISPFNTFLKAHLNTIFITSVIAQFAIVIAISFFITRISYPTALILYIIYSFLMGVTFSSIFQVFTFSSIVSTFFITAGMFGLMALYGAYTKSDLSRMGSILNMGLIGLIIALVVNLFWRNSMFDIILSFIGVIIFAGLTAVNIQQIKQMSEQLADSGESENKISLIGALTLYLNFVNLFLSLLRLTGKRQ